MSKKINDYKGVKVFPLSPLNWHVYDKDKYGIGSRKIEFENNIGHCLIKIRENASFFERCR